MHELTVDKIKARRIEITDGADRTVVQIGCDQDNAPLIRLMDADGNPRAVMGLHGGKPRLGLLDSAGHPRLCLILRDDVPGIEFMDKFGNRRILLFLADDDGQNPDLFFVDGNKNITFGLKTTDDGLVKVMSQDKEGRIVEPIWFAPDLKEDGRTIQ